MTSPSTPGGIKSVRDPIHTYHWTLSLSTSGWAWEFLRRDPAYRLDWANAAASYEVLQRQQVVVVRLRSEAQCFAKWGLLPPFPDPDCDARTALPLWSPTLSSDVLPIIAIAESNSPKITLPLPDGICRTIISLESDADQHVLLAQGGRSLQLHITGASISAGACLFSEIISPRGLGRARDRARGRFGDFLRRGELRASLYRPAAQGHRLAHVLQALDGELSGISRRDIAISLFGQDRVERDWDDPRDHLRDHVRRAVNRGKSLMKGQYRQLLKQGT